MVTIDKFLLNYLNSSTSSIFKLPPRDVKVLKSLAKIINSPIFITENQANLLLKILKEHKDKIGEEISDLLEVPTWSKTFRQIDKTRKLYMSKDDEGNLSITIEFTYSAPIRKVLFENSKKISGLVQQGTGKIYRADLTEKNIVELVDLLKKYDFEIDEKIEDFYKTINSWEKNDFERQFLLTNITHQNFQKSITTDLGLETAIDHTIIADRSIRYQYFYENFEKNPENLTEKIAYRKNSKIWIDKKTTSLDEIIESLVKLKRLPLMIVFDHNDQKTCSEDLEKLSIALEKNEIFGGVGIYFRLPNDGVGTDFNAFIAEKKYNAVLDSSTKIVGVQHGKIPKFFIKNNWKPMSVLAIGNSLRQTKTAVYANHCDLIITYSDTQPIIETRVQWE